MLTYRSDIDGLRAVAVLGVVLFHAMPRLLPGGFAGVDVFFVISGFLITSLLQQDIDAGRFSIARFYARRIRRIFPALLVVLATVWLLGYGLLMPGELRMLGKSMVHSALFANNFMLVAQAGYFDIDAELKPLLNLWSLAVEEQFYIFWPWLLAGAAMFGKRGRWLAVLVTLVSLGWSVAFSAAAPVHAFFLPHYRFWELLAGALLAVFGSHSLFERHPALAGWAGIAGMASILASYVLLDGHQVFPGWRALFPVLGACLIILAGPQSAANRFFLANRMAIRIGLISYPLYLWHWPLLSFGRILFGELSPAWIAGLLALSAALSAATYRFVEIPIRYRTLAIFHSRRFVPVAGLSLLIALGVLGDATNHAEGYPGRVPNDAWQALEWPASRVRDGDCAAALPIAGDYCQRWADGPVSHVLIGDSHANHFFPGLGKALGAQGGNLVQVVGPLNEREYDKVRPNLKWLAAEKHLRTVFVAYHYGRMTQADNPFGPALERLVSELEELNVQVVFIVDGPEFDFDPRLCTSRPPLAQWLGAAARAEERCVESLDYARRKRANYEAYVAELQSRFPRLKFIDAFSPFCRDGKCFALQDQMPIFRDRHHLSLQGSEMAFQKLPPDFL